jgi:hypothetical protein
MKKEDCTGVPQVWETQGKAVFAAHLILWVVLVFEIGSFLISVAQNPSYGIFFEPEKNVEVLRIRDFSFLFNFAQRAWLRDTTVNSGSSIYSVENHLKVTSDWAGTEVPGSLQFGYSPTMLWVLAPVVPFSSVTAYLIFNVAGLFAVFWMTRPGRCRWGIGLLPFFSGAARYCFVLGQTALATGAGLLFVAEKTGVRAKNQGWRTHFWGGAVLWALTAKPPIALSAAAVLIGLRQWRILLTAGVLTVLSTLILWPLLGPHWLTDYMHLLGTYNTTDAGPAFVMAVIPSIMTSLRAILSVDIGLRDDIASLISLIVWLSVLGYITLAGLRSRLPAAALWSMSILSYLLFCPHVSPTDEIQVVVILALCVSLRDKLTKHELFLLVTVPLLVFMAPISGPFIGMRLPLFLSQLALFFFFAFSGERFASTAPAGENPAGAGSQAGIA